MTKFADPTFSVAAPLTKAYAEGYARTFQARLPDAACTECSGSGRSEVLGSTVYCPACRGTGLRAYQDAP